MRRLCVLLLGCAVMGCTSKKVLTADEYFQNATRNFRSGSLTLATQQFHELLDQHPFSEYNEEAELRIGHAHYLNGNYPEAVVALTDFQRRHPTSPFLPFVGYYLGMCYVQQMGSIDRDQTASRNAQTYFLTVAQQYPNSPYADLARQELARCRESLAEHELYVARFYSRRGNSKAAEIRLLTLAARYGDTEVAADGLMRLADLYRSDKDSRRAALAYQALADLHPRAPQAARANRALKRLGGALADGEDPIDLLLASNGRQRSSEAFDTVILPAVDPSRMARGGPPMAPAMAPPMDPFGRRGAGRY